LNLLNYKFGAPPSSTCGGLGGLLGPKALQALLRAFGPLPIEIGIGISIPTLGGSVFYKFFI